MNRPDRHFDTINPVSLGLLPLSLVYLLLSTLHRLMYVLGLRQRVRLPVPVIVVGNITVGGTGKTPLVIWLANKLAAAGYRPGILTRGYGGTSREWPRRVTGDSTAEEVGDEPVVMAQATGLPVCAGPDRAADGQELIEQGCDVLISDDGLQHHRLAHDIEIAVIDGQRRFGNGWFLPAGPLREGRGRLKQVDFIVCRGGSARPGEIAMALEPDSLKRMSDGDTRPANALAGQAVHAIAGIGNPHQFFDQLVALGMKPVPHGFADHHRYQKEDVVFDDGLPVVMTAKDAVKCHDWASERHWVLLVQAGLPESFAQGIIELLKEKRRGQKTA